MTWSSAQYEAQLLVDSAEQDALNLATGRYQYLKNLIPELPAAGVAELSHAMALEKVAASQVPGQVVINDLTNGDSSLAQYHFVQADAGVASSVVQAATAGQRGILGVLQNAPALGEACVIAGGGITQVLAGVAVTKGAALISDATGRAITATAGVGNHVYGYALEAASGANALFRMAFGYAGPVTNAS